MARTKYPFSPALDGVRGAFMVVFMLYHFGARQIQGAWVGVPVFFTLSAFLITRLLASEAAYRGGIDVWGFYRRRMRRLFPALAVVLLAIGAYAAWMAPGWRRHALGGDLLTTGGYAMNWRLLATADNYFSQVGAVSPLRHAWTLAIEEQFYLLVPFLVWASMRWVPNRWSRVLFVGVLAVAATGWAAFVGYDAAGSLMRLYYGTDTRAAALLIGVALGFWSAQDGTDAPELRRTPAALLGSVGLLGLVIFTLAVPAETGWVWNWGGATLVSLLAAMLILACASSSPSAIQHVLAWRPLAATGRVSYGLYLWHWPVYLVLAPRLSNGWVTAGMALAITGALAWLSWIYLERPVLARGIAAWRNSPALGAVLALAAVGGVLTLAGSSWATSTKPPASPITRGPIPDLVEGQPIQQPGRPARVLVIGDSLPLLLAQSLPTAAFPKLQVRTVAARGCDTVSVPFEGLAGVALSTDKSCMQQRQRWPQQARAFRAQVLVVFPSSLLLFRHRVGGALVSVRDNSFQRQIAAALDRLVSQARAAGVRQVVVPTLPCRPVTRETMGAVYDDLQAQSPATVRDLANPASLNELLVRWARGKPGVEIADLQAATCAAQGEPRTQVAGVSMYQDFAHFSADGSPLVWKWLLGQVSQSWRRPSF